MSVRTDGRGHWPRFRRRNPAPPNGLIEQLRGLIGVVGWRYAGRKIGVDPRQLRRWLAGDDWPSPDNVERMRDIGL